MAEDDEQFNRRKQREGAQAVTDTVIGAFDNAVQVERPREDFDGFIGGGAPDPNAGTIIYREKNLLEEDLTEVARQTSARTSTQRDIDDVSRFTGYGSLSTAATKAFYGINHRGFGNPIPMNKDQFGLTFFTKPKLNLSYDNISRIRTMSMMLSDKSTSIARAVRAWLDPVGAREDGGVAGSPLVDNSSPWITILTNNLMSISGWPDPVIDTYTSKSGLRKEEWSMVDGTYRILNSYTVTATFKNIQGDPISMLFHIWCMYMSLVYDGTLSPRLEEIFENRIDYQSRIYRLTLDSSRTYVEKIGACGVAFPEATTLGAHFNYSSDTPYNVDNDQISIPFRCTGADYLDPITVKEFNEISYTFNPALARPGAPFKKLAAAEKPAFNTDGYPIINEDTNELEIWVPNDLYTQVLGR